MDTRFTVEESNLICVFASESKAVTLESRSRVIEDIERVLPYLEDTDMLELSGRVIGKLRDMTDEEFKQLEWTVAE
ncbi:transposon-transfer assisting family protein [Lachnospiraceae bacterium 29-84]